MRKTAAEHPDDIDIAALLDGALPGRERSAVALRIVADLERQKTFTACLAAMQDAPADASMPPASAIDRVIAAYRQRTEALDVVLSLAKSAVEIFSRAQDVFLPPAFATSETRSLLPQQPSLAVVAKEFDAVVVETGVEKTMSGRCNFLVFVKNRADGTAAENQRVELLAGGRELDSRMTKQGNALFEDLGPGRYDIVVRKNGEPQGKITIKVVL